MNQLCQIISKNHLKYNFNKKSLKWIKHYSISHINKLKNISLLNNFLLVSKESKLKTDLHQIDLVKKLDTLYLEVISHNERKNNLIKEKTKANFFYTFKSFWKNKNESIDQPKGLYIYGGVGSGKTFLMDFFYKNIPIHEKERIHFHSFMLKVHEHLHELRKNKEFLKTNTKDPITYVADTLLKKSWIFCIDEFQIIDIADAFLLKNLFTKLISNGAVMVMTSNRSPKDLYKNGLQRTYFLPFIDYLEEKCHIHSMNHSIVDYRRLGASDTMKERYLFPINSKTINTFNCMFMEKAKGKTIEEYKFKINEKRFITAKKTVLSEKLIEFSFLELCGQPLGTIDYTAIANSFDTVFIRDIPELEFNDANQVRRFIILIDCFYDCGVQLFCLAEKSIETFYETMKQNNQEEKEKVKQNYDEVFSIDRTVSRLFEMNTGKEYRNRKMN